MELGVTYWSYLGIIYLIILTVQDYRNNMKIDDRKNYFMMGLTISLISHSPVAWWYILALVAVSGVFTYLIKKSNIVGKGDVNTILWVFFGYALLGMNVLIVFAGVFFIVTLLHTLARIYIFKYTGPFPFYPVILITFLTTNTIFWRSLLI